MNLNLRKAAALLARLDEIRRDNQIPSQISLNVHSTDLNAEVELHNKETARKISETRKIIELTYKIRNQIAEKKSAHGVNEILTKLAECDALISFYTSLSRMATQADLGTLVNRANAAKSAERGYSSEDFMIAGSLSLAQIADAKSQVNLLKNKKTDLNDQLIGINVNTSITLDESDVETLKKFGLTA